MKENPVIISSALYFDLLLRDLKGQEEHSEAVWEGFISDSFIF